MYTKQENTISIKNTYSIKESTIKSDENQKETNHQSVINYSKENLGANNKTTSVRYIEQTSMTQLEDIEDNQELKPTTQIDISSEINTAEVSNSSSPNEEDDKNYVTGESTIFLINNTPAHLIYNKSTDEMNTTEFDYLKIITTTKNMKLVTDSEV